MRDLFSTGIRPAVDKYLAEKAAEKRDYGDYWSASSAGYCMRKQIFERLGVPSVNEDARKTRVFAVGDVFHQWMQDITKNAGLSIAQELELQDEGLMVRGHIDDLVLIKKTVMDGMAAFDEHHLILYDYKTQNSRAFSWQKDRPMSHYHRNQLGTYMYIWRKLAQVEGSPADIGPNRELTEGRILKISKDDLRMSEDQLLWSPALEKEVVGYWSTLNGYWKAKTIPKCTCGDFEGGFLAKAAYNPYFLDGEPCNIELYRRFKESQE